MERTDRFVLSGRVHAVDMASFKLVDESRPQIDVAYFRPKYGKVVAHFGHLWDYQVPSPRSAEEFLARLVDGRYGPRCEARWNGDSLWAPGVDWDRAAELQGFLAGMLDNYPNPPEGWSHWWRF